MVDQVRHQGGGFTTGEGPTLVVERAKHHLDGDACEWCVEALRDLLANVEQDEVEEEGRIEVELDAVGRGFPEGGEIPHAFGDQEGICDPPAPAIQLTDVTRGEGRGIEHVGERAIPLPAPEDRDPA